MLYSQHGFTVAYHIFSRHDNRPIFHRERSKKNKTLATLASVVGDEWQARDTTLKKRKKERKKEFLKVKIKTLCTPPSKKI